MTDPIVDIGRAAGAPPLVAALTDYGAGPYRALLEASARYPQAPHLQWLDLDHSIPLGDVRAGALTLRRTVPHLPPCVCVAVVDPGVGTERRAIAVATPTGHRLVGPDNGLLEPTVRRLGGAVALVDLRATTFRPHRDARTFDGRDLFGPVAGALAAGATLHDVGEEAAPGSLVALALPAPRETSEGLVAVVLEIDAFGTVVLALDDQLAHLPHLMRLGESGTVRADGGERRGLRVGQTFADVPWGELVLYLDSDGALALARREGSAAKLLGVRAGDSLVIALDGDPTTNEPQVA
ncbi:MAG: SAM-dependent chlorinase/fluorinase [Solirubrobacteraceae bacterium]|nr:SAM-dependent chlorinase/fluorinase [Solirubrobacteraceae bacterium]